MKPKFVCQLSQEKQEEIKKMLTGLLLYEFGGDVAAMQAHHEMSLDEAVQRGMDSKIADIDYRMVDYLTEPMDEKYRLANPAFIFAIWNETMDYDIPSPFAEQSSEESEWER